MNKPRFERGLIHVIMGHGPGKTTSAIGLGVRAAGYGYNVCMIQFLKCGKVRGTSQDLGEIAFLKNAHNFKIVSFGRDGFVDRRYITLANNGIDEREKDFTEKESKKAKRSNMLKKASEDIRLAGEALEYAESIINEGECDVVILDEVNVAMNYGLVDKQRIAKLIRNKPSHVELILTGRNAPREIINFADYVTIVSEVKHPLKSHKLVGRKGIEF